MEPSVAELFYIDKTASNEKSSPSIVHEENRLQENSPDIDDKRTDIVLGLDEEEAELENLVFGGKPEDLFLDDEQEKKDISQEEHYHSEKDFQEINHDAVKEDSATDSLLKKRKPAWIDEDDKTLRVNIKEKKRLRKLKKTEEDSKIDGEEYEKRLRSQYEKLVGKPDWAEKRTKDADSDDEDEFFRSTRNHLGRSSELPQSHIAIRRVKDANIAKYSNASVKSLEFHPFTKVILTAGFNKTLSLYQIDGETNPCIQTIFLENFPIHTAHFTPDGQRIIMSSRRKHFYVLDMASAEVKKVPRIKGRTENTLERFVISPDGSCVAFLGESGYINLVSLKTMQFITLFKMNGTVNAAAFSGDGSRLFTCGGDGEVYVWDMKSKRCLHKFRDEGCIKGVCMEVSKDGRFVACGSNSGVVNIYDEKCFSSRNPKPVKTVMNLTTSINCMKFNATSEILAISSRAVKDALKLLHMPSLTVFSNWPTKKGILGYIQSLSFSPQSGYLAIGNDAGKAILHRLRHYPDG